MSIADGQETSSEELVLRSHECERGTQEGVRHMDERAVDC